MFYLKVQGHFSSAHNLRQYQGKCEALHGHNWKVEVVVKGLRVGKDGMLMDFSKIKSRLNQFLDTLDHKYLNNIAYFKKHNPTSEEIAKYIFDSLKKVLPGIKAVTVWESETAAATYEEE